MCVCVCVCVWGGGGWGGGCGWSLSGWHQGWTCAPSSGASARSGARLQRARLGVSGGWCDDRPSVLVGVVGVVGVVGGCDGCGGWV